MTMLSLASMVPDSNDPATTPHRYKTASAPQAISNHLPNSLSMYLRIIVTHTGHAIQRQSMYAGRMLPRRTVLLAPAGPLSAAGAATMHLCLHQTTSAAAGYRRSLRGSSRARTPCVHGTPPAPDGVRPS